MKKKLKDLISHMHAGLTYQDSAEFLSMNEKMKILGYNSSKDSQRLSFATSPGAAGKSLKRRIALVSNGNGTDSALHYAIEASQRQGAEIDLLVHRESNDESIERLETQISQSGINYRLQPLGSEGAKDIIDYIANQKALIFMVAVPDDSLVRTLIEDVLPRNKHQFPVPLVLIENAPGQDGHKNSKTDTMSVALD